MSDSVQPHRWQPTRLPRPWDSPGKNTGVGCHFLLQCMKVKSESEVAQSCKTPSDPMDCSLPGSSIHGIFQARVLECGAVAFSDGTQPSSPQIHYPLLTLIPFVCVEGGALVWGVGKYFRIIIIWAQTKVNHHILWKWSSWKSGFHQPLVGQFGFFSWEKESVSRYLGSISVLILWR